MEIIVMETCSPLIDISVFTGVIICFVVVVLAGVFILNKVLSRRGNRDN